MQLLLSEAKLVKLLNEGQAAAFAKMEAEVDGIRDGQSIDGGLFLTVGGGAGIIFVYTIFCHYARSLGKVVVPIEDIDFDTSCQN